MEHWLDTITRRLGTRSLSWGTTAGATRLEHFSTTVAASTAGGRMTRRTVLEGAVAVAALLGPIGAGLARPARAALAGVCGTDFPTVASLRAARTAIASGAANVALSPGGCLRYQRTFNGTRVTQERTVVGGRPMMVWNHDILSSSSSGSRDGNLDGFNEWQATITHGVPPNPVRTSVKVSEFDPGTRQLVRRRTFAFRIDGTMHVTVEQGTGTGSSVVVAEYDAPSMMDAGETASAVGERQAVVACPSGLKQEVIDTILRAAQNGGKCLNDKLGMYSTANALEQLATRPFLISCETGTNRRAAIDAESAFDIVRPVSLFINVDRWVDVGFRERVIFHEMLHAVLHEGHDPALDELSRTDDNRWRELDRVSSCSSLCYNPNATKCECARCLQKKTCSPPCSSFKPCYSNQVGGFCNCPKSNRRFYPLLATCDVECPHGLACFTAKCQPEENPCKVTAA
jgi:hypothetical protein